MGNSRLSFVVLAFVSVLVGCASTKPLTRNEVDARIEREVMKEQLANDGSWLPYASPTSEDLAVERALHRQWIRGEHVDLSATTLPEGQGRQHHVSLTDKKDQWHAYFNVQDVGNVGCALDYGCLFDLYIRGGYDATGSTDESCVDKHRCWKLVPEEPFSSSQMAKEREYIRSSVERAFINQKVGDENAWLSYSATSSASSTYPLPHRQWIRGESIDLSTIAIGEAKKHYISPTDRKVQWHSYLGVPGVGNVGCALNYDCLTDLYRRTDNDAKGLTDESCVDKHACWKLVPAAEEPKADQNKAEM